MSGSAPEAGALRPAAPGDGTALPDHPGRAEEPPLRPENEAALAEVMRTTDRPLIVKGGGTRQLGTPRGRHLETGDLAGIRLYEPGALTLVAGAGTPLAEIEEILAKEGQRLAFEPPDMSGLLGRNGLSTLGGIVAANASGPRRVQAGAARDFILGLRFVDGTGAIIANGGRVMKNVTGYDLSRLLAGSRGRLGVITEVALKVLPAPEQVATLAIEGLDDAAAVAAMAAALGSPYEVTGAAHWPGKGTFLRIEGFAASVDYRAGRLVAYLARFGEVRIEPGVGRWGAIRDVVPFHEVPGDVWRVSAKATEAPALVARARPAAHLFDWGGGLIWMLVAEGADLRARLGSFAGHATRVRGTGGGVANLPPEPPGLAALVRALAAQFDPRGVLAMPEEV